MIFILEKKNNNREFKKISNNFRNNIFYYKKMNEDNTKIFNWKENYTRKEIYKHFEKTFILYNNLENEFESKPKKQRLE